MDKQVFHAAALALLSFAGISPATASPWAEVGENQTRADIELLQSAGVLNDITIQWPMPWQSLLQDLAQADPQGQPALQTAVQRLVVRGKAATTDGISTWASLDASNRTSVVYGFNGMGRGDGQAQFSLEGTDGPISGRISLGAITQDFGGKPNKLMLDGSYLAARLGGVLVYAGYLDHWWGPGEISALQLSNNARPMPQLGLMRSETQASSWPILRWLGPWQFEFFLGTLDGPQIQSNVRYSAARLAINPLPGLEIAAAKTEEFCGQGHPCSPLRDYFTNFDFSTHPNNVNGQGSIEFKYGRSLGGLPFQIYAQMMNEDYSWLTSSGSSTLVGSSIFLPTNGNPVKLTAEYTNTIATKTPFSFGNFIHGYTYTDTQFPDGMHYRGRTLGFSLDTDSTLLSLQGCWSDEEGRFYQLALHHAVIGNHNTPGVNIVSRPPVLLNMAEARLSLPFNLGGRDFHLDLAGRLQDDQPRPHAGSAAAVEVALKVPI